MIKVNGQQQNISAVTIAEYLLQTSYDTKRIAVELNGEIIPKAQYDATILKDGDNVEIVSFVGGG